MSDRTMESPADLLRPVPELGLAVPDYGGRSLPNIPSSIVRATGTEIAEVPELLPPLASDLDPFEGRRAEGPMIVVLVDGLGWSDPDLTEERVALGYPRPWVERARPITTAFPTTTTVVLTSLTSAEPPSRHGVVGHRMYLPRYGVVAEILRMSPVGVPSNDALAGPQWIPAMISGAPTIFRRGLGGTALSRDRYASSAFTRMLYDGATYVGFSTGADFAHRLNELLRRRDPPPAIFAYWDDLDTVQHIHGPCAEFDAFEAAQVRQMLVAARRGLSPKLAQATTVLVTGDHGQVSVTPEAEIVIDSETRIARHLARPPTGDRRAAFLSARPGHLPELTQALEDVLPPAHRVIPMPLAVGAGLFGPPPLHPELLDRLGDLLVLVPAPASISYRIPGAVPRSPFRPGAHGGLDPAELIVPLVTSSLSEI